MSTLEDKLRELSEQLKKRASASTEILKRDFEAAVRQSNNRFPEHLFIKHYLGFFSGQKSDNDAQLLTTWYNIAGTPYSEVDLVDRNANVVATVPPVLNRDVIPVVKNNRKSLNVDQALEIARQQATLSPKMAQSRLSNSLNERFIQPDEKTTDAANNRWTAFLEKYNGTPTGVIAPVKEKPLASDMFDYD